MHLHEWKSSWSTTKLCPLDKRRPASLLRALNVAKALLLVMLITFGLAAWSPPGRRLAPPNVSRYLHFDVCNGFANQRIAIVTAALLAKRSRRTLVIPVLGVDGEQLRDLTQRRPSTLSAVHFSAFYDMSAFTAALLAHKVTFVNREELPQHISTTRITPLEISRQPSVVGDSAHVHVGCPVLDAPAQLFAKYEQLFWSLLSNGLIPSAAIRDSLNQRLRRHGQDFNFLHLRIEDDWVNFCRHWTAIRDKVTRDNCIIMNPAAIVAALKALGIAPGSRLYIASHWAHVAPPTRASMLSAIRAVGYHPIISTCTLQRELCAAIDYYYALSAKQFVGNSVSTFSALLIMERRQLGQYATYYNGGTLPVAQWLPFYKLAWILVTGPLASNGDLSKADGWVERAKSSIESGIRLANVLPFVLLAAPAGQTEQIIKHVANLGAWLKARGVPMLIQTCSATQSASVQPQSPRKVWSQLAALAFEREWRNLAQHTYVLVSSDNLRFTERLDLFEFGSKLPAEAAAGACDQRKNMACAMLVNFAGLRRSLAEQTDKDAQMHSPACAASQGRLFDLSGNSAVELTEKDVSGFVRFIS